MSGLGVTRCVERLQEGGDCGGGFGGGGEGGVGGDVVRHFVAFLLPFFYGYGIDSVVG